MRRSAIVGALALLGVIAAGSGQIAIAQDAPQGVGRGAPQQWWSYKTRGGVFTAPNKALWKLADLKRAHAGQNNWQELIVRNPEQQATYNSAAPGTAFAPRMHTETPTLFVVIAGEINFDIQGQAPITATRGSLVNVLQSTVHSFTIAGAQNALWIQIDPTNFRAVYPAASAAPPRQAGSDIVKVAFSPNPGGYTAPNMPHWNFFQAVAQCSQGGVRVNVNRIYASPISGFANPADPANTCPAQAGRGGRGAAGPQGGRGAQADAPFNPASTFGHMHPGMAEWWIVQSGRISGRFENAGEFVGEEGDVLYAPPMTWHQMGFDGPGISNRLAIAPFPFNNMNNTATTPP